MVERLENGVRALEEQIDDIQSLVSQIEALVQETRQLEAAEARRRDRVLAMYGGWTCTVLALRCGMPEGSVIDKEDKPHRFSEEGVDAFQMWVSTTGDRFHARPDCEARARIPCNLVDLRDRAPCPRCVGKLPDNQWYPRYLAVLAEMEECGLPHPPAFTPRRKYRSEKTAED